MVSPRKSRRRDDEGPTTSSSIRRGRGDLDLAEEIEAIVDGEEENVGPAAGPSSSRDVNGGDDGDADAESIYPKSDDEPSLTCRLSGNTVSGYTELCRWSTVPKKFSNIHDSTKFKDMLDRQGNIVTAAEELKSRCITLAEMRNLVGRPGRISCPVYVHVVAKRKVDVLLMSNKILIIPLVVVADSSGYGVVCSFNEGLETVYNRVNVGDCLLLTSFFPQLSKRAYHKGLFSDDMFLDLELKVQYYTVRNQYLRKFSVMKLSEFRLPEALFCDSYQLKVPNELEKELQNKEKPPWVTAPISEQYFDVIGVISYVSRIERYRMHNNEDVECLVDNKPEFRPFRRFQTFRWIHVVDRSSRPLPVKMYHLPLQCQDALVPGAIVVISHCQKLENSFSAPHTCSSYFSQIYVGRDIQTYFMILPTRFRTKIQEILGRTNYVTIISRDDIQWAVGGMPAGKIVNESMFHHQFIETVGDIELPILARRESHRFYFTGTVIRAFKVDVEDAPSHYCSHNRYKEFKQQRLTKFKTLEHHLPFEKYHKNLSWYSFIRKLPPIDPDVLQLDKSSDMVKKLVNSYKQYCDPLLLPAKVDDKKLPPAADLEKVDGPPYFFLDIVNEEKCFWFRGVWKSCEYTMDEMISKIDSAKGKQLKCSAEVFCLEEHATFEVTLHDFLIDC